MKRFSGMWIVCLGFVAVASAVPSAEVGCLAGTHKDPPPFTRELQLTPHTDLALLLGSSNPFQSFGLAAFADLTVDSTDVAALNGEAIAGGDNLGPEGPDGGDPLSPETVWLYAQLRAGTLFGYEFTPGNDRKTSACPRPQAIWLLEGEEGCQTLGGLSTKAQEFVGRAEGNDWTAVGNVRVLNLYPGLCAKTGSFALDKDTRTEWTEEVEGCVPASVKPPQRCRVWGWDLANFT